MFSLTADPQVNPVRPHVRLARSTTIRKVQDIVHRNFGNGYRVELFGSTSYGVDTATSDLDLVIMVRLRFYLRSHLSLNSGQDGNRMDGFPPSLDLGSLPCKCILHAANHSMTWDFLLVIYNVKYVTARMFRTLDG